MRVTFWPFCSQQHKRLNKFLLAQDSGVKLYTAFAKEAKAAGWECTLVLPIDYQCDCYYDTVPYAYDRAYRILSYRCEVSLSNVHRRLQWDPPTILAATENCDVLVTTSELLPIPARQLRPGLRIVVEHSFPPPPDIAWLFQAARSNSDLVHCTSRMLADELQPRPVTVWPPCVADEEIAPRGCNHRNVVLFPARCSEPDYTGFKLFEAATKGNDLARCTDPTGFLREQDPTHRLLFCEHLGNATYYEYLHRTRVAVGLTTTGTCGMAFREAALCGATPVALRTPAYIEVLGADWPYYCEGTAASVRSAIAAASARPIDASRLPGVRASLRSNVWKTAKADLEKLLC